MGTLAPSIYPPAGAGDITSSLPLLSQQDDPHVPRQLPARIPRPVPLPHPRASES